jgi:site-specific DNA-cytosine methylase
MGILSLFSGCGGCSLGLRQAGFQVNLAVDVNKDACDTYSANLGQGMTWCTNLSKVTPNDLLEKSHLNRENVDLILGGPPCQGFSSAGARDWTDPRNVLLRECARIQSFPDWYEFQGATTSIATQIGNAIPPLFMEILGRHIQTLATWHRSETSRGRWLGIDATKSNGKSPILIKVLAELEEKTHVFSYKASRTRGATFVPSNSIACKKSSCGITTSI